MNVLEGIGSLEPLLRTLLTRAQTRSSLLLEALLRDSTSWLDVLLTLTRPKELWLLSPADLLLLLNNDYMLALVGVGAFLLGALFAAMRQRH